MLKTCRLKVFIQQSVLAETDQNKIPNCRYAWTKSIYCKLKGELTNKVMRSWHLEYEKIFNCENCNAVHACCLKRKVRLALTCAILDWLVQNSHILRQVDFPQQKVIKNNNGSNRQPKYLLSVHMQHLLDQL